MKTLDEARGAHPHLGYAVYAIEAGGPVTLEIFTPDGQVFSFHGQSEEVVFLTAFPEPEREEKKPNDVFD